MSMFLKTAGSFALAALLTFGATATAQASDVRIAGGATGCCRMPY